MNLGRHTLRSFYSVFLSYILLASFFIPVSVRASHTLRPVVTPAVRPMPMKMGHRSNELLVRFKQGVSDQTKASLLSGKGSRKALHGRSRVDKLTLTDGGDLNRQLIT